VDADKQIALLDGRKLAYAEFGQSTGYPVLYFHGSPACRLEPLLIGDAVLSQLGCASSLPIAREWASPTFSPTELSPIGLPTSHPSRIPSVSTASPFSATPAAVPTSPFAPPESPNRLASAVIVSGGWRMDWPEATQGLPFVNRLVFLLAKRAPPLLRLLLSMMSGISEQDREKELAQLRKRMPPADYAAFAEPGRLEAFSQMMRESSRQGAKGVAWDMQLCVRDFGFRPEDIHMPLTLFHGEQDTNAPIALARRLAATFPNARILTFPSEAHLSTLCNHIHEVAQALREPRSDEET
jgi:hypothetical protein